jgi:hypothetical protein
MKDSSNAPRPGRNRSSSVAQRPCGALARDLPETALRATSPRSTTRPSTAPLTCTVVCGCEVLHGVVNRPRIDGKDGVAGSIPAGGSTNKGNRRAWGMGASTRHRGLVRSNGRSRVTREASRNKRQIHSRCRPASPVPHPWWLSSTSAIPPEVGFYHWRSYEVDVRWVELWAPSGKTNRRSPDSAGTHRRFRGAYSARTAFHASVAASKLGCSRVKSGSS